MQRLGRLAFLGWVLGITGCDHATKQWIVHRSVEGQSWDIVRGLLQFRHTLNTDTAFSLLGAYVPLGVRLLMLRILAWVGVVALSVFVTVRWKRMGLQQRFALALVLGGALGNAVDRLIWGHVVDFIRVPYWPVFNVADIAITVGAGLLLLLGRRAVASER